MAEFSFVEIARELNEVQETGVNFEKKQQKWGSEEEVQTLIDEINKCSQLVYLNLEGNTLGVEAAKSIGKALEKHSEFKKALWKDLFTGRLKEEIPEALKHLSQGIILAGANLTVLDCSDNALGPNGMVGLVDLLQSSSCYSLQELKLNNCGLGIQGGKMLADALLECYKRSCAAGTPLALKVFLAGRNRLENEGAKALAKVFSAIKTLEEISIPQNGICHEGITALAEGFKVNEGIRILNLNDNIIKQKGALSLAQAFVFLQKLREIDFGDCLLKTKGACLLADALQDAHHDLEVINFGANEIGPDGGLAIVTAVLNKKKIRRVTLDSNQFGCEARERIKEMMRESFNANALDNLSEEEFVDEEEYEEEESESGEEEEDNSAEGKETDNDQCDESEDDLDDVNYVTALSTKTFGDQSFESNNGNTPSNIEITPPANVETFCNTAVPSIQMFNALTETNKVEAFKEFLHTYEDDEYLIYSIFTILKCSSLSQESADALNVAEALYKEIFQYAIDTRQVSRVKNFFLIQLGLLKCEDKTFKPSYNQRACRYALKQTLLKNTFPSEISDTFNLFLDRFP